MCSSTIQDGSIPKSAFRILRPEARRLVLLDREEVVLYARYLLQDEEVCSGYSIDMPVHKVLIGDQILSKDQVQADKDIISVEPSSLQVNSPLPPSVNFELGKDFEKAIRSKFGHPINFNALSGRREFILVISFGRAKFRPDIHTTGIILQACFGGLASKYRVKLLQDRTFKFSVASRSVGFEIYNKNAFSVDSCDFRINLWGNGGPN